MKETLSRRLDELVNSVLDMDYTKSIPVQCREMDIHYQTFMKYYKGISECNAANLIKIAVYYNVSVDYLLGRTNVKKLDMDISGCCKLTGLSETAVEKIIRISSDDVSANGVCSNEVLNLLIENSEFDNIISAFLDACVFRVLLNPTEELRLQLVSEFLNQQREKAALSPQIGLVIANSGLSPYFKQRLSESIWKMFDCIIQSKLSEEDTPRKKHTAG